MAVTPLESATVLITGATGFVGGALLRRWLSGSRAPAAIRCLVRDRDRALAGGVPQESLVVGDLADEVALARAVDGADAVVHAAGAIKGLRHRDYFATNDEGTARLLTAVERAAPMARFVHVSSLAAAGPSVDGVATDAPPEGCRPVSVYGESKLAGERRVVGSGLDWIVLRPGMVYGPGDAATRLVVRQALGCCCLLPRRPRPLSLVHVDDLARVLEAAVERGGSGVVVPVAGPEPTTTHGLVAVIARVAGRKARVVGVPDAVVRVAGWGADLWARLRGRPGLFSGDKVRELVAPGWVADGAVMAEVLGVVGEVGLEEGWGGVVDL